MESIDLFESVLTFIKDTLADGETLKISGFGSFVVKEKKSGEVAIRRRGRIAS